MRSGSEQLQIWFTVRHMSQKAQYIYAVKGTFRWLSIVKTSQLIYIHMSNDLCKKIRMKWIFNASPCRIYPLFLQDRITLNTMPRENIFNTICTKRLHFVIQSMMYLFSCLWTHEPLLSHILIRMKTPWLITVHMCSFSNKLRKSSQQVECVCTLRSCNTGQQTPLHVWK